MSDTDIGAELGAPGHPAVDQLEAARAQVSQRAAKLAAGMAVYRAGEDPLPEQLHHFAQLHGGEFNDGTMAKCEHGGWAQVLTVFPSLRPDLALCDRCANQHHRREKAKADQYGRQLASAAAAYRAQGLAPPRLPIEATHMDCDLCLMPHDLRADLQSFALAVGHILILGFGCGRCLQV